MVFAEHLAAFSWRKNPSLGIIKGFERQKSASCGVVIRFTLYLSILIPDTRSARQSQRVFFIELDAAQYGLASCFWRRRIQV